MATSSQDRIKKENAESTHALNQILCILRERGREYDRRLAAIRISGSEDQLKMLRLEVSHNDQMIYAATQLLIAF